MRLVPVFLALLLATPAAVQAQSGAQASPQAQPGTVPEAERKICRREEGVGSRLGARRCLTRSQWADLYQQQANNRNDLLSKAEREEREPSAFGDRPL